MLKLLLAAILALSTSFASAKDFAFTSQSGARLQFKVGKNNIKSTFKTKSGETLEVQDFFASKSHRTLVIGKHLVVNQFFNSTELVSMTINGVEVDLSGKIGIAPSSEAIELSNEFIEFQNSLSPEMAAALRAFSQEDQPQTGFWGCSGALIAYVGEWVALASCPETLGLGCALALAAHPYTVYAIATQCH